MNNNGKYGIYRLVGNEITTFHYFHFKQYSKEVCEKEGYELIDTACSLNEARAITPRPRKNV